jgi:hypothetical protein
MKIRPMEFAKTAGFLKTKMKSAVSVFLDTEYESKLSIGNAEVKFPLSSIEIIISPVFEHGLSEQS